MKPGPLPRRETALGLPVAALAGRPNTGKTTLFNALTGLRQRVANFAGCTVEKAVGLLETPLGPVEVVDLPGTSSLLPSSQDERVAFRFLAECAAAGRDLRVLCVAEASNLQNDLALALGLRDCGYRTAVVVNMMDEARSNGISIDASLLSREIGMPVFLASARDRAGLSEIEAALLPRGPAPGPTPPAPPDLERLQASAFREAEAAVRSAVSLPRARLLSTVSRSIRIDRWLFHPVAGPLILAATLFLVFEALFALGGPLRDGIASALAAFSLFLRPAIPSGLLASLLCDGVLAGISAVATFVPQIAILFLLIGVLEASGYLPRAGAMVDRALRPFGLDGKVFIPFLSSFACAIPGVMAARTISNEKRRLAAVLLCPLMTCSARIPVYTLIISAFVPSSFRVLGLNGQGVVMAAMYLIGVLAALALAMVLRSTPLYEAHPSPVTILPPYRVPRPAELARYVWIRCWHFLSRAGKVIFALSLVLWVLSAFPKDEKATAPLRAEIASLSGSRAPGDLRRVRELEAKAASLDLEKSLLGRLGGAVEPVFRPIGYDWRLSVAVLSSLAAREVFVGTLGTLFALGGEPGASEGLVQALREARTPQGAPRYTLATAVSLLFFFAIALQCVSTITVVRRETGSWRWPALQFASFFLIAYSLSWAGYRLTNLLLG